MLTQEQQLSDSHQLIYDLRVQINQLHLTIGRMYENERITADMIAEALDQEIEPDDSYSLEVIYNSWGGKENRSAEADEQFFEILNKIKKYL